VNGKIMDGEEEQEDEEQASAGPGVQLEVLKSLLAFARRAIRARIFAAVPIFLAGVMLTSAAVVLLPRTFTCQTVLMTMGNSVLDGMYAGNAFAGASDLIMRHENLEAIIKDTDLVEKSAQRRPTLAKLKDRLMHSIVGEMSEKSKIGALVGALESKVEVSTDKGDLSIRVDWTDGQTAADVAGAARESFLRARHTAEVAAFEDKMAILDGHAAKLRTDIGNLAQQMQSAREERLRRAREDKAARKAPSSDDSATRTVVRRAAAPRTSEPDADLPALKEKLEATKKKLADLQGERERQLHEAQAKFDEMKLRMTAAHPEVITQGERVAMLAQVPSEIALLQAEVADVAGEIHQREGLTQLNNAGISTFSVNSPGGGAGGGAGPSGDALPAEVVDLLQLDNLDPALSQQLSSTVIKYGAIRDDILSARLDLDTAQAAFKHRYQIIVPADVPFKPTKPKPAVILGIGLFASLLLALLVPVALELRTGIIIERWQVHQVQLPILAELRLPPSHKN
jgi:uncharacterized protein involved in exopolysaccharide biosynthesis